MTLSLLIDKEALIVCPLLDAREFTRFCRDRGIDITEERLERLEKLKLLAPILRMDVQHGRPASWDRATLNQMLQEGRVWDPASRQFSPWSQFKGDNGILRLESFYSAFQCYAAQKLTETLTVKVQAEFLVE